MSNTTALIGKQPIAVDLDSQEMLVKASGIKLSKCSRRFTGPQSAQQVLAPSAGKKLRIYLGALVTSEAATGCLHTGADATADDCRIIDGDWPDNGGEFLNLSGNFHELAVDEALNITTSAGNAKVVVFYTEA